MAVQSSETGGIALSHLFISSVFWTTELPKVLSILTEKKPSNSSCPYAAWQRFELLIYVVSLLHNFLCINNIFDTDISLEHPSPSITVLEEKLIPLIAPC